MLGVSDLWGSDVFDAQVAISSFNVYAVCTMRLGPVEYAVDEIGKNSNVFKVLLKGHVEAMEAK